MLTSSQRQSSGSQAQNSASTRSMTSSRGLVSKASMRSSWHCTLSRKAATRMAQVRTMPSGSRSAREMSSIGGIWLKSGMGGSSTLPFLTLTGFWGGSDAGAVFVAMFEAFEPVDTLLASFRLLPDFCTSRPSAFNPPASSCQTDFSLTSTPTGATLLASPVTAAAVAAPAVPTVPPPMMPRCWGRRSTLSPLSRCNHQRSSCSSKLTSVPCMPFIWKPSSALRPFTTARRPVRGWEVLASEIADLASAMGCAPSITAAWLFLRSFRSHSSSSGLRKL
mmetsp:Transcript_52283/g.149817  ORF Transcript_52283/g.149817 Transcript_52283/m.149817 type:complete len:278 (-) Transcript_52283:888-1721(-)